MITVLRITNNNDSSNNSHRCMYKILLSLQLSFPWFAGLAMIASFYVK
jgi:hypothetical protein